MIAWDLIGKPVLVINLGALSLIELQPGMVVAPTQATHSAKSRCW